MTSYQDYSHTQSRGPVTSTSQLSIIFMLSRNKKNPVLNVAKSALQYLFLPQNRPSLSQFNEDIMLNLGLSVSFSLNANNTQIMP